MIAARSLASIPRQPGSARCAASIARRVSAAPMRGTSATTSPEAGLTTAKVAPESASTHAPSMWAWRRTRSLRSALTSRARS
jgi:hypothetical protein